ncbi:hypothetical protein K466DRAFT_661884 [Polyporus arcularius HHB13444]|uniref:Fungal-type protein kinase domain-containing protein n=1 Tax=Polyporus arcularius HHB13444 TaxID=1314778 RepID=A0A5C3PHE1_9APHY|nr:hypothetical protein K466DRAFT_661884 [Polyporus arcularius HHB13444]
MSTEMPSWRIVHGVHHDLVSLYWVLVWIVLRHTAHNFSVAQAQEVFPFSTDRHSLGVGMKIIWANWLVDEFEIPGNEPLTKLLRDMALPVLKSVGNKIVKGVPMTYDDVLQLFDEALDSQGWPEMDYVPCTWLDESQASSPWIIDDSLALERKPSTAEKPGLGAPRANAEKMPPPTEISTSYEARLPSNETVAASAASSGSDGPKPISSLSSRKRKAVEPAETEGSESGRSKRSKGSRRSENVD